MTTAQLVLDGAFDVGVIDRRLFGSFVEHMGRCVYTGIYEPGHSTATPEGYRGDVLALVRELGVTVVRYPGGNFVSGYRWEDGIGPVHERPSRLDLAWRAVEPNTFGTDEFMSWARQAGVEPMMAVNLGTRGVQEACDLLEYTNHRGDTHWSDLRIKNGATEPHGVRLWCLGNELDGPWQIGAKTPDEYGRLAAETAKAMRMVDPSIELVACGSSNRAMPTFGTWEATVLEHTYDLVDHVSLHTYYDPSDRDLDSFLASAVDMEDMISSVVATADHMRAVSGATKRLSLSFDEWNVWNQSRAEDRSAQPFADLPTLIEDDFTIADAVVVGSLLVALLRHADRVSVACQAQLVNVIGLIRTLPGGPAWRQATFHPFALTARHARGRVLRAEPRSPVHETRRYGEVPVLHATATHDDHTGRTSVFVVNRSRRPLRLRVDIRSLPHTGWAERVVLADHDLTATNTATQPDRVSPQALAPVRIEAEGLDADLAPVSWNLLTFGPSNGKP
ncbi:MAG: alpha-N-arabinofuranosidase [Jiangellaceae bacterium]